MKKATKSQISNFLAKNMPLGYKISLVDSSAPGKIEYVFDKGSKGPVYELTLLESGRWYMKEVKEDKS